MSALQSLIPRDAIRLDVPAADWRDAIRESGALLTETGIADPAYTDSMVRTVEEHGPYIVIAPGFALAHARPDESVKRTGMSFVRLAEPVEFGNDANDPVTIVMALAAADSDAHRQALAALAGVLADPDRRRGLDLAQTPDEVLAVLDDAPAAPSRGRRAAGRATPDASAAAAAGQSASGDAKADPGSSADAQADPGASTPSAAASVGASPDQPPSDQPASASEQESQPGTPPSDRYDGPVVPSKNLLLTVCGNGVGTSLFLKNTTESVLDRWGWMPFITVEATDTISARGRAKEADALLTSGAIADALGEVGVPVEIIDNFTSADAVDTALRRIYDV